MFSPYVLVLNLFYHSYHFISMLKEVKMKQGVNDVMKSEYLRLIQDIVVNLFFLSIGVLFFVRYETVWIIIYILTVITLTLLGLSQLIEIIRSKTPKKLKDYLPVLSSFGFTIFIGLFPVNFFRFVHIVFGWYILINAVIQMIDYYVYRRDSLKGASLLFIKSCIGFVVAISLIFVPRDKLWVLSLVAGIYFIFHAVVSISEDIKDLLPDNTKNKVRKHLSVAAPVLLAAMIPQQFFFSIKGMIKQNKMELDYNPYDDTPADLEVFIYLKESGPESLGHVDISFKNKIYSYGCHDPENRELFGTLGDGVLIVSDRNSFLENAIQNDEKTIIGYKIELTENQKAIIQKKIDNLLARCVEWSCKAKMAYDSGNSMDSCVDYASRVFKTCRAKMYKFIEGKYKTYFVFSTNCVLIADYLIRTQELDLIKISGIVTPGSYISFLNQELLREKSCVIERTVYQKETI